MNASPPSSTTRPIGRMVPAAAPDSRRGGPRLAALRRPG